MSNGGDKRHRDPSRVLVLENPVVGWINEGRVKVSSSLKAEGGHILDKV
jgi:hypothetical protein